MTVSSAPPFPRAMTGHPAEECRNNALKYDREKFKQKIKKFVETKVKI
jgi:hypothetical protein